MESKSYQYQLLQHKLKEIEITNYKINLKKTRVGYKERGRTFGKTQ